MAFAPKFFLIACASLTDKIGEAVGFSFRQAKLRLTRAMDFIRKAMLRARVRMVCMPSPSFSTSPGIPPWTLFQYWLEASIEYENEQFQHLGSVVTNLGYSDWATTAIDASIKSMWYRLSRREDDYRMECSTDGVHFYQLRVCHLHRGGEKIRFGIYACSPEDSSFVATFTDLELTECKWLAHDGQQPDEV